MNEHDLRQLLDKYLHGTASDQEIEQIKQFESHFLSDDERVFASDEEREQVRAELYQRIRPKGSESSVDWRGMAAAAVLLIGFAVAGWWLNGEMAPSYEVVLQTGVGERGSIELSDGTQVFLNAESSLEMRNDFDGEHAHRLVRLRGEGYFVVAKDSNRPFIASAGDVDVRVLGTEFNFRAYEADSSASVALVEGKVRASHRAEEQVLAPDQQWGVDQRTGKSTLTAFDAASVTAWRSGSLVFDRTPLSEWAHVMQREFGLEVRFKDPSLGQQTVTGRFDQPEKNLVIKAVLAAKGLAYEAQSDRSIVIYQPK